MFIREDDHLTTSTWRRRRFWLLVVGIPMLLLGLAVAGWLVFVSNDLQRAIAEADAQDPKWRLDDLEKARATPPKGQNAADRADVAYKLLPPGWIMGRPPGPPPPSPWPEDLLANLHPPALLNEQQVAAVQAILKAAGPQALAEARSLIDTPRGRAAIVYSDESTDALQSLAVNRRDLAVLLHYDALDRAQAGDLAGAVADCHATFHVGCSLSDEPFLIPVSIALRAIAVGTLERVLAQGEPPADRLAALQARLEAEEPAPLLLYALRGERAGVNRLLENMRNGRADPNSSAVSAIMSRDHSGWLPWLLRMPGFIAVQEAAHLRYMNAMIEIARRPPEEWESLLAPHRANIAKLPLVVRLIATADYFAQACQRNHAALRNAIVALAAERFRQEHGHWPATPDELVQAKLLTAVPTDPYDGKPIKFGRTADGLIVYCVGPDGVDNGGTIDRHNAIKPGTDIGFQLWDPAARRGPAPPPKPGDGGA